MESEHIRTLMARQQTAWGAKGAVGAGSPLAAGLGAEALRGGGNAYDAVVTAALAETVLLPSKCGLAGDLVALCISPENDEPDTLIAVGPAAAGLGDVAASGVLPLTGPLSVGIPAAPNGYAALSVRGRLGADIQAGPAIQLARDGFCWSSVSQRLTEESLDLLHQYNRMGTSYLREGEPLEAGTVVRLPGLARALEEWVDRGSRLMEGPVGRALVERVQAAGGVVSNDDLLEATAEWVTPVKTNVAGMTLWATPEPTHGDALLQTMLATSTRKADDLWNAARGTISARAADSSRDSQVDGTSIVVAVDADGTVVSLLHSNSFPRFGAGLVVDEFDLILSNRAGRGFSTEAGPHFPSAGRRPWTTLHAWAAGDDRVELVGGTPGGANQLIWNAQVLSQIIDGQKEPAELVTSPRWEWLPATDGVRAEADINDETIRRLMAVVTGGVERTPPLSLRSVQIVALRPRPGDARVVAADPRECAGVASV